MHGSHTSVRLSVRLGCTSRMKGHRKFKFGVQVYHGNCNLQWHIESMTSKVSHQTLQSSGTRWNVCDELAVLPSSNLAFLSFPSCTDISWKVKFTRLICHHRSHCDVYKLITYNL